MLFASKDKFLTFRHNDHLVSALLLLFSEQLGKVDAFKFELTFLTFNQRFYPLKAGEISHLNDWTTFFGHRRIF